MPPVTVYLALGSNLGDRPTLLEKALALLSAGGVTVAARSAVYETDAVADHPQPPYLNMAARARTALPPEDLLRLCLQVERQLGRVRAVDGAVVSRTLDADILLYGPLVLSTPTLTLPHPRLLDRPFVRIPLADVAESGLQHPVTGERLDVAAPSPSVRRLASAT